jgi:WD40 repeat protein
MTTPIVSKVNTLTGHRDCVYTLQQSIEPHLFFSGAGDGMVVSWNAESLAEGELVAKLPNSVYSLLHLPNTDLLLAGQNYEGIHLLDWRKKKELASLKVTSSSIFDMQVFGNDLWVATGEGSVIVVDLEKWVIKKKILATEKSARTISINLQRGECAIGYSDFFIRVFALDDFRLIREWQAHSNSIFTIRYLPNSRFLMSGSRDAKLKVWDTNSDYKQVEEIAAHLYAINHIVFSPDGNYFATASMDKSIKVWDTAQLKLLKVIDRARHTGHGTSVNKLLWMPFRNYLVSASDDRSISIWDIEFGGVNG